MFNPLRGGIIHEKGCHSKEPFLHNLTWCVSRTWNDLLLYLSADALKPPDPEPPPTCPFIIITMSKSRPTLEKKTPSTPLSLPEEKSIPCVGDQTRRRSVPLTASVEPVYGAVSIRSTAIFGKSEATSIFFKKRQISVPWRSVFFYRAGLALLFRRSGRLPMREDRAFFAHGRTAFPIPPLRRSRVALSATDRRAGAGR